MQTCTLPAYAILQKIRYTAFVFRFGTFRETAPLIEIIVLSDDSSDVA